MPAFAIYYGDGTVAHGETARDWRAAPDDGVQIVRVYHDERTSAGRRYWKQWDGCDWYWMDADDVIRGVASREWGTDQPKPEAPDGMVKRGTGVSDARFAELSEMADQAAEPE